MHSHSAARQIHWIIMFAGIRRRERKKKKLCVDVAPAARLSVILYRRASRAQTKVMKMSENNDENEYEK